MNQRPQAARLEQPLATLMARVAALFAALLVTALPAPPASAQGAQPTATQAATVYELSQGQVPLGEVGVVIERTDGGYVSNSYVVLEGLMDMSDELTTRPDGSALSYSLTGSVQGIDVAIEATFSDAGVTLDIDQAGAATSFELAAAEPLYVLDNNLLDGYQVLTHALLDSGADRLEVAALVPQAAALGRATVVDTGERAAIVSDDQQVEARKLAVTLTVRNQVIEAAVWVDDAGEIVVLEQTVGAVRFERRQAGTLVSAASSARSERALAAGQESATAALARTAQCVDVVKVQVPSTGAILHGLLSLPLGAEAGRGAPTLVLLPGSGAVDLRGNAPPMITNAGYEQLANTLGCHGYGVLRVAKLGIAPSTGDANAVTLDTYAFNTADWLAFLAETPGVDPRRLGVIGHSEGGLVALYATASGVIEPKVIVLIATAGRPFDVLLREQLLASARRGGADAEALARVAEQTDEVIAAVQASEGVRLELEGELADNPVALLFAHAGGLLRSEMAQDPARLIAAIDDVPIVIFQGQKDLQVLPLDGRTLAEAAPAALLLEPPNLTHNLVDVAGPAVTGLVPGREATVSQTLTSALATFLNGSLRLAR